MKEIVHRLRFDSQARVHVMNAGAGLINERILSSMTHNDPDTAQQKVCFLHAQKLSATEGHL